LRSLASGHILDIVYQIETMLGELEQIVILAVLRVGDAAYGVPVHDEIVRLTRRDLTIGTVYKTLARLEDKGFVRSYAGDPTPQRGGRRTRCFAVTITGRRALESTLATLRRMAVGLDVGLEPT
jgi:PadR family transcriptional regulator, regulatory protein PadR